MATADAYGTPQASTSGPRARSGKLDPKWTPPEATATPRGSRKGMQKQTFSEVGETGFKPATARPPAGCATRLRHSPWLSRKRATGIEPALEAWKASVQPQHFARSGRPDDSRGVRPRLGADEHLRGVCPAGVRGAPRRARRRPRR